MQMTPTFPKPEKLCKRVKESRIITSWLDRGAWRATVHAVTKGMTQLSKHLHKLSASLALFWVALLFSRIPQTISYSLTYIESESESEVAQSCPTLCDPMDCSLPGSSVHGVLQARVLEWVAISFSRGSFQPRDQTRISCIAGRCFTLWTTREDLSSVQFSSVTQSCPTLWDPINRSTPGLPVHHQLLEFTQTHTHQVSDAIQPSHPLSSPSPPAPNPSQHQGLFQWVNSSHEVAKVLEFQLQHQSFQWTPRTDLL